MNEFPSTAFQMRTFSPIYERFLSYKVILMVAIANSHIKTSFAMAKMSTRHEEILSFATVSQRSWNTTKQVT